MIPNREQFRLTVKQKQGQKLLARNKYVLLRGGSRSGKTFLIVRAIIIRAMKAPGTNHAIFRFRNNAIKGSVWKTFKEVMKICWPDVPYKPSLSSLEITLPNGSVIDFCGLDDADRVDKILGKEYSTLFFNEASQIPWPSVETALSRLAEKSDLKLRAWFDLNPTTKHHWSYEWFFKNLKPGTREKVHNPDELATMQINPDDNRENIAEEYFDILDAMSAAKRKRFRDGDYADATEGALWTLEGIDALRVAPEDLPEMRRVVVAVDPSGSNGKAGNLSDDIGIVIVGEGDDGRYYILGDWSCNKSPEGWARQAINAYHNFQADMIVAETNYGGAMVEAVIRAAGFDGRFKEVKASRGKHVRAEPISALYEQGKVSHAGEFDDLEDELCAFTTKGFIGDGSPDKGDALVWGMTELSGADIAEPSIRGL